LPLASGEGDCLAQRADGTTFPAHLSLAAMALEGQRFFAGFLTDRSALKRVERMQNEFVAMVNHELRTPLTSIKSSLGILKTGALGALSPDILKLVEIGYGNCDRLIRIINDLLDLEKVASGALRFEYKRLSLRGFLDGFFAVNRDMGRDGGIALALSHTAEELTINIDPERMAQVLTNLVSNAIKFSPDGSTVRIVSDRRGSWVRLSVEDRGPGISPAFRSRIFTRFAQEDSSSVRKKGGNGLGLSISKAIVEAHGGRIDFESAPGKGTVFFVDLPLAPTWEAGVVDEHSDDLQILVLADTDAPGAPAQGDMR
jgi:signal transduction histidine kinase